jgi:hypothetical protein
MKKTTPKPSKSQQKMAKKRANRVKNILDMLPLTTSLITVRPSGLPLIPLWIAYRQFILGFYESSILNSTFAAEYAILVRLNEKLSNVEKTAIAKRGLTFYDSINRARKLLSIDDKLVSDLRDLNNLRNMNAHPSNWVALYIQLDERDSFLKDDAIKEWISSTTKRTPRKSLVV